MFQFLATLLVALKYKSLGYKPKYKPNNEFQEALLNRLKDCKDVTPNEESLQKTAVLIEEEMFSLFK